MFSQSTSFGCSPRAMRRNLSACCSHHSTMSVGLGKYREALAELFSLR